MYLCTYIRTNNSVIVIYEIKPLNAIVTWEKRNNRRDIYSDGNRGAKINSVIFSPAGTKLTL